MSKRGSTKQAAVRMIYTILALPVGEWVSTKQVCTHLAAVGFTPHSYTVVRDLKSVAVEFGIEVRTGGFGGGYFWKRNKLLERI